MRGLLYACLVAINLWDDESWHLLSERYVRLAREAGALTVLPLALEMHCASQINAGEFAEAQALIDEADAITAAAGSVPLTDAPILLAGWRGDERAALERIAPAVRDATDRGEETTITLAEYSKALLFNGLGRHPAALAAAQRAGEHHPAKVFPRALIELVEAAARASKPELTEEALEHLCESATLSGTDWALGMYARARALVSTGEQADRLYQEAIERLERTRVRVELARAQLLYGEWLRRETAAARRAQAAARRPRAVPGDRHGSLRRACGTRAARDRREHPQTHARHGPPADGAGGADRAPGPRRPVEPGDRRAALHQPAHGPVPPAQGLRQARDQLAR